LTISFRLRRGGADINHFLRGKKSSGFEDASFERMMRDDASFNHFLR
jgi:hypothetical protein